MSIKNFLEEVRFKTFTDETEVPFDRSELPYSSLVVYMRDVMARLDSFKQSTQYSLESLANVERDVKDIFGKINEKIDLLEEMVEGYQYLNTNELGNDVIHSLKVFSLKDGYNPITKSVTLPRLSKARELRPNVVVKGNILAEETFKLSDTYRDSLIGVTTVDKENTEIVKVLLLDGKDRLIDTLLPVDGNVLGSFHEDVKYIKVQTNNVEEDRESYTRVSILENRYSGYSEVMLGSRNMENKGNTLKLLLDTKIPIGSFLTLEVGITYTENGERKEHKLKVNGTASKYILEEKGKQDGRVMNLEGFEVDIDKVLDDYVLVKERVEGVKHLGNKVFDISSIKSDTFTLTLKALLYSISDNTKTPEIKGVFAYVTER